MDDCIIPQRLLPSGWGLYADEEGFWLCRRDFEADEPVYKPVRFLGSVSMEKAPTLTFDKGPETVTLVSGM